MRHQHASSIAVAAVLAALAATPAGAATRIGSSLTQRANLFLSCGSAGQPLSQCTVAQTQLGGVELVVPSHGVIVRWRVRSAGTGSVRLRVLQPAGGGGFTAVESSAPETMSGPG